MVYAERTSWTAAELATFADGDHYELVKGRLIQMAPATADHGEASLGLGAALLAYAEAQGGHAYAAETGFNLTLLGEQEETVLGPDAAYIRAARVRKDRHGFVAEAPDLAVEVASPSQFRPEMEGKAQLWLARGCRAVWIVWPHTKTIDIWRSGTPPGRQTLRSGDDLADEAVLPGFRYPVARVFRHD